MNIIQAGQEIHSAGLDMGEFQEWAYNEGILEYKNGHTSINRGEFERYIRMNTQEPPMEV